VAGKPHYTHNYVSYEQNRHVRIYQVRHEVYITFAEYQDNDVKYLNNTRGSDESPGFLTLHIFGPRNTQRAGDMKDVGRILLAIALRAERGLEKLATT
jgi:hypothetical protein